MAMAKRCEKLAFMNVKGKYHRMTNFTEIAVEKNPKEYSRQYVDEEFERSSVVGYSTAVSYSFDYDNENEVHSLIKEITDKELVADEAVVEIVMVDVVDPDGTNKGMSRRWSVIPETEGNSTDAYTYSGSFRANGPAAEVSAVSSDGWKTVTVE